MCFVGGFLPGFRYGGPVSSVAALSLLLKKSDVDFRIIAPDRDLAADMAYEGVIGNEWNEFSGHTVYYVSSESVNFFSFLGLLMRSRGNSVYLNSLFHRHYSISPLIIIRLLRVLGRKHQLIIAPRSELMTEVLRPKRLRKTFFLLVAKWTGLFHEAIFHGTSDEEIHELKRWFPRNRIYLIENPVYENEENLTGANLSAVPPPSVHPAKKEFLRIIFLSRISPKKNLYFLLEVLSEVNCDFHIDIWGPGEDQAYLNECNKALDLLGLRDKAVFRGELQKDLVVPVMSNYDVLCLPTKGENFGHVIAESLRAGTVTITSNHTPWSRWQDGKALSALPLDTNIWRKKLEQIWEEKKSGEMNKFSEDARRLYSASNSNADLRKKYLELFRQ